MTTDRTTSELEPPPARLGRLARGHRDALLAAVREATTLVPATPVYDWVEKCRRFASLYGRNLRREAGRRFGRERRAHLEWMGELLHLAASRSDLKGSAPYDPAVLNAAYFCAQSSGAAGRKLRAQLDVARDRLAAWRADGHASEPLEAIGEEFGWTADHWRGEAARGATVVVLSPNPYSLYSLAVLAICETLGVNVVGVLIRRFSVQRAVSEYRRDGLRLVRKVWRKLILRSDENPGSGSATIRDLVEASGFPHSDVRAYAKARGIEVASVSAYADAVDFLEALAPDVGLFTGGGLVPPATLRCFTTGVINVHLGHLPYYRGMDVVEAPLLEGRVGNVGATAMFMDKGLDTGQALVKLSVDPSDFRSLGQLRNALAATLPFLLVDAALGQGSGRIAPVPQSDTGRQCYMINRRLRPALDAGFSEPQRRSTPPGDQIEERLLRLREELWRG